LNFVRETPDGRRIVEIDLDLPIAGRPYDFVLVLQERLNYLAAYRTGSSNNDIFHALTFRSFAIADVYHHGARA
jgi:hypothetical protein